MEENGYPVAPAILGVILGTMLEEHFITSMIKADGRFLGFFERPIAAALGIATILLWLWPLLRRLRSRRGAALG
jgi:TctA family transporter